MAGAVGIGLAASSERSAEAAHLLWEQVVAGSIPAAPITIFPPGHSVLSPGGIPGGHQTRPSGSGAIAQQGERRPCTAVRRVRVPLAPPKRRDGRAADCGGLENRRRFTPSGGSNPPPSAMCCSTGPANFAGSPGAAVQIPLPLTAYAWGVSVTLRAASIGEAAFLFPSAPAPRGEQAKAADSLPKRNGAALYVFCVVSHVTPQRQHARRPTFPPGVIFSRSRLCQSAPYECRPTRSPV